MNLVFNIGPHGFIPAYVLPAIGGPSEWHCFDISLQTGSV